MAQVLQQQRELRLASHCQKHNGQDRRVRSAGVAICLSRNERTQSASGMVALRWMMLFAAIS